MRMRVSRWDGVGAALLVAFGVSLWALWAAEGPAGPPPAEALLDPSAEIQLGDEWMGLYFKGDRVGLMHVEKSARAGGGYRYEMETRLRLLAFRQDAPLDVRVGADLDGALTLERFDFELDAGPASIEGRGVVEGRRIEMTVETGGEAVERVLELAHPPVLRGNLGPLLSRGGLEAGRRVQFVAFDPMTQADQVVEVEVVGPATVLVMDREVPATHIRTTAAGMTLDGWINERGEMLRQELGLGLVAVRETREQARFGLLPAGRRGADLIAATMVPVAGLPASLAKRSALRLRVGGVDLSGFELADRRQGWAAAEGVLTIRREAVGAGLPRPVRAELSGEAGEAGELGGASNAEVAAALAADGLVQSDHPKVVSLAERLARDAPDTVAAARAIARWVHDHVERRAVVGVPSALETLERRVGDCNEHSTLFAALARAAGVPTRVVVGLVYVEGAFGYHAWNEVLAADGWVSVDATWDQMPVDVGHVAFLRGGLSEQVRLLPVIGRLELSAAR